MASVREAEIVGDHEAVRHMQDCYVDFAPIADHKGLNSRRHVCILKVFAAGSNRCKRTSLSCDKGPRDGRQHEHTVGHW
jgi:hypothetical protein